MKRKPAAPGNRRLRALAIRVFGKEGAASWFAAPNHILNGSSPLKTARTPAGARRVDTLMKRIDLGVA